MKLFIQAERSADWDLHLYTVKLMLRYLHAAAHLNYSKSAQVYLQQMSKLITIMMAEEFEKFATRWYFTIRRFEKVWSGIWTGMRNEQVLMRSIKASGGLTQGRGMKLSVIAKWVNSMAATSSIKNVVESVCGVDLREHRPTRDLTDMNAFKEWLLVHNSLNCPTPLLTSISSGIMADEE